MLDKRVLGLTAIAALALLVPVLGNGPSFHPDATVKGSSLAGWHPMGQADWRAQNGEIIGTPRPGGNGGWLVLDRSYQDVGFYASVKCTGGCKTGVLLRAEKTPQGMKGIYFELTGGDVANYRVTLDAEGKELQREPLRAPESGSGAVPRERRDHQHLSCIAGPDDQEQRVVPHQIFRRSVERGEAHAPQQKQRQGLAERMVRVGHRGSESSGPATVKSPARVGQGWLVTPP